MYEVLKQYLTHDVIVTVCIRISNIVIILIAARVLVGIIRRLVSRGISTAVTRSGQKSPRLTTLQGVLISTISYTIYFVALILVLFAAGISPATLTPLLGAASVLGLAIGFGAQRLVRDIITGLFILGEGQFDVGDWVSIGGVTGRVEDIGLRVTQIRDDQGRNYVIANGDITQVFNASRGSVKLVIEIPLLRSQAFNDGLANLLAVAVAVLEEYKVQAKATEEQPTVIITAMDAAKVTASLILWVPVRKTTEIEDAVRRRLLVAQAEEKTEFTLA